jgi:hypothetical protein
MLGFCILLPACIFASRRSLFIDISLRLSVYPSVHLPVFPKGTVSPSIDWAEMVWWDRHYLIDT